MNLQDGDRCHSFTKVFFHWKLLFKRTLLGNHYTRTHRVSQNFSIVSETSQHKYTKSVRNPSLQIQLLFVLYFLFQTYCCQIYSLSFFTPLQIMSLVSETHIPKILPYFIYYSICSTWWPTDSLRNSLNVIFSKTHSFFNLLSNVGTLGVYKEGWTVSYHS